MPRPLRYPEQAVGWAEQSKIVRLSEVEVQNLKSKIV